MKSTLCKAAGLLIAMLVAGAAAAQSPAPGSSQQSYNTPPPLPPDYRARVVAAMVSAYAKLAKGRPEISDTITRTAPLGASTSFCVRYPAKVKFYISLGDRIRHPDWKEDGDTAFVIFNAHRSINSNGTFMPISGAGVDCKNYKGWKPFPDLERAAAAHRKKQ